MDGVGATCVVRDVVAIIDDEPLVLRALTRILAGGGHRLLAVSRVEDLGDLLRDPSLAVVLLDLFMGESGGLEALARIRSQRPDVEVVVMTGRASVESAVLCMRAGASDYLSKPFSDIDRVRAAVDVAKACAVMGDGADVEAGIRAKVSRAVASPTDWTRVPLAGDLPMSSSVPLTLEAYERLALERALHEAAGDAAEAARRLGIGRSTFYRKAAKLGVDLQRRPAETRRAGDRDVGPRPPWFGGGASIS